MPANLIRRSFLATAIALPLCASAFPDRSVEWVVPYPAGGGTDVVADYTTKSKGDGHVVLSADTATLAANPFLYSKLSYNVEKDFAPVGLMARFPMILVVNPSVPAKNLAEFLTWAKAQTQGASFATPGAGSPHHLATELLKSRTGLALTHVPYRGAVPAVQDVVGGQVHFMFVDTASGYAHILSGKLRPLGVASPKRVKNFETIPTLLAALDTTTVKARFQTLGLEPIPSSPKAMAEYARAEREKWGQVIRTSNIKLD